MAKHFPNEQDVLYSRIYGGIAFPGQRPGYIAVAGELRAMGEKRFVLLDEFESFDTQTLIARASGLDAFYRPEKWLTSELTPGIQKSLMDFNKGITLRNPGRRLRLLPSRITGLGDDLFRYSLPKLKSLISEKGQLDISKGRLLLNYLSIIQDSDIAGIKLGEYPAVEAAIYVMNNLEVVVKTKQEKQFVENSKYEAF